MGTGKNRSKLLRALTVYREEVVATMKVTRIWRIGPWRGLLLSCIMLFWFFPVNGQEIKLKWNVWGGQAAFAQETDEEVIIETDLGPGREGTKTVYKVQPKLKEWKIKGTLAALDDAMPEVQAEALHKLDELEALDRIPQTTVPKIAGLLDHPDGEVRLIAIETLGKMGTAAQAYVAQLVALLGHENPTIQAAAASAVGKLGESGKMYIPRLIILLEDRDVEVRTSAVNALNHLDQNGKTYIPKILALLENGNWRFVLRPRRCWATLENRPERMSRRLWPC